MNPILNTALNQTGPEAGFHSAGRHRGGGLHRTGHPMRWVWGWWRSTWSELWRFTHEKSWEAEEFLGSNELASGTEKYSQPHSFIYHEFMHVLVRHSRKTWGILKVLIQQYLLCFLVIRWTFRQTGAECVHGDFTHRHHAGLGVLFASRDVQRRSHVARAPCDMVWNFRCNHWAFGKLILWKTEGLFGWSFSLFGLSLFF